MNKRVPFIAIAILFIIGLIVWAENIRATENGENESMDNIKKNAKYQYEEDSNYLYKEPRTKPDNNAKDSNDVFGIPDTNSNDDAEDNENESEYEFIELKSGYKNAEQYNVENIG